MEPELSNQQTDNPAPETVQPQGETTSPASPNPGRSLHKWIRTVLAVLIGLLVVSVGVLAYRVAFNMSEQVAPKKEVSLIRHGMFSSEINTFYPADEITDANILDINLQIFEGLVQYENETRIKPLLATSWSNPDAHTWVFDLKTDVKFHTGRTMTAKDVKYSLELFKDKESAIGDLYATTIDEVTAESDTRVKVKTTTPDPTLLNKLVFLFILDSEEAGDETPVKGTGPYQIKPGTTPDENKVVLAAFDGYHGGRVLTREVEFINYDDEEKMVTDLQAGKLEVSGPLTEDSVATVSQGNFDIYDIELLNVAHFGLNHNHASSPVKNKKFREALYLAIDPEPFIKLRGVKGDPASQIVPAAIPGHDPEITRPARDLEKAKALLKEAGYDNGAELKFTYFIPRAETFANELKAQLQEIGVTVTPDLRPLSEQYNKDVEMYYINYGSDIFDASDVMAANFQTSFYRNSKVDNLLQEASGTLDQSKRIKLLQEASAVLMEDVAWLPLFTFTNQWAISKDYAFNHNLKTAGFGGYYWQVYAR